MASHSQTKLSFVTLDVFTSARYLGNPLAVVFVPSSLRSAITQKTKQRIAREFNLSETVFLHTPDEKDDDDRLDTHQRQIDIFTPDQELPFAGHPTIGSAYLVLHHLGLRQVDSLLTRAGAINIRTLAGGRVKAQIPHAVHIHSQTLEEIIYRLSRTGDDKERDALLAKLSDNPETREAELSAPVVSIVKGMTFVLVRLPTLAHLAEVSTTSKTLDFTSIPDFLDKGEWENSFISRYYYVVKDERVVDRAKEWDIQTRMIETTFEDPATGSAACTLASYLALGSAYGRDGTWARFNITQGVEMGRKSDILVEATAEGTGEEAKIKDLFLGGTAVVVMEGSVLV
ncbi:hypothetical protein QBC37DRAFT_419258 [Rhypophila decipiens]|uniref:Phenazine biosynthesis-like protein n=1 Tax=Rhypophila decipiens TaxID=261697 RepID=A0AAN7B943_9PEZI|nr:hypothetical protein QBC37DRAFT_419258 [Rhypophila decipiens]